MPADRAAHSPPPDGNEPPRPGWLAIRTRWPLILAAGLLALAAGLLALSGREPSYAATARLLVDPVPQGDKVLFATSMIRDSGDPARTADTVSRLVATEGAADATAATLGRGFTAGSVLDAVSVEPEADSNVIAVSGSAEDPRLAARLTNAFVGAVLLERAGKLGPEIERRLSVRRAELRSVPQRDRGQRGELGAEIRELTTVRDAHKDPTLVSASPASAPPSPDQVPGAAVAAVALLGGLLVGAGAALALERLTALPRS